MSSSLNERELYVQQWTRPPLGPRLGAGSQQAEKAGHGSVGRSGR